MISWFEQLPGYLETLGKSAVVGLYNGIAGFIGNVWDFFINLPGQVWNWLVGMYDDMVNIGKSIITGLINGVESMGSTLANAIVDLIPSPIRSYVEEALGIASPSKVARGWGVSVVQGFVEGVDGTTPSITAAMNRVASTVTAGRPGPALGPRAPTVPAAR